MFSTIHNIVQLEMLFLVYLWHCWICVFRGNCMTAIYIIQTIINHYYNEWNIKNVKIWSWIEKATLDYDILVMFKFKWES